MLLKVNMNIKVVTKNFTFLLGILLTFGLGVSAKDIPNIQDTNFPALEYPIRENAFVMILQPVPDGYSDYTMTLCNKQSMCRQTSMQENGKRNQRMKKRQKSRFIRENTQNTDKI